jgi:hypothetical protein
VSGIETYDKTLDVDARVDTFGAILKKLGKSHKEGALLFKGKNVTHYESCRERNAYVEGLRNNDTLLYITNECITLNIYLLSGKQLTVDVETHACITTVKNEIENKYKIYTLYQQLFLNNVELYNEFSILHYNISQNKNNNVSLIIKGTAEESAIAICKDDVAKYYLKYNDDVWEEDEYQYLLFAEAKKRGIDVTNCL